MIVLLSGTSGSGKTYIVEQLLKELGPHDTTIRLGPRHKQGGYVWERRGVTIMGEYTAACGGCDRLSWKGGSDDIEQVVVAHRALGHKVVLEGLLVGTWGIPRMSRLVPLGLIVIHLSTPVDVCVAAVEARRLERATAAGKEVQKLNPSNTIGKHKGLLSVLKLRRAAGIPVEFLDRLEALIRVKELII
jgi:hypothetical protein